LEKLKKFTAVMLGFFAGIVVLAFIKYDFLHLLEYIPFSFWGAIGNNYIRLTLVFGLTIYFLISMKVIRHEKNTRFLQIAWLLIAAFNIAPIARYTFLYFTWKPPVVDQYPANGTKFDPVKLIMAHTSPIDSSYYIIMMVYPLCWVIICTISLLKIRKEKRNEALPTPS
jgi:hypothetical protein